MVYMIYLRKEDCSLRRISNKIGSQILLSVLEEDKIVDKGTELEPGYQA
jgi:hypothetical protein